jgi:cell wall-associated NlpC family hydrolase
MSAAVAERQAAARAPLADLEEVAVSLPPLQQPRPTSFKGWEAAKDGLLPGDHIWVSCGVYGYHAIYVGNGRFIHKVSGSGSLATAAFSCNASVVSVGASSAACLDLRHSGVPSVLLCSLTQFLNSLAHSIVHFLPGGGLIFTEIEEFSPNSQATIHVVQYRECFHPADTVDLAFSALIARDLYRYPILSLSYFFTLCVPQSNSNLSGGLRRHSFYCRLTGS